MISITVHHHNQTTVAPSNAQATAPHSSSNVEVQYLARYLRPARANLHCRSSSSAAHLAREPPSPPVIRPRKGNQLEDVSTDLNNNNNNMVYNAGLETASSLAEQANLKEQLHAHENIDNGKIAARLNSTTNAAKPNNSSNNAHKRNHMKLHSRSISLIINPEFSSDSDSELAALGKKRGLPRPARRTRLLVVDGNSSTSSSQSTSEELQTTRDDKRSVSSQGELHLQFSPDNLAGITARPAAVFPFSSDSAQRQPVKQEQQRAASAAPDNFAQFRQVGAALRQISDEFFKSRRRTI